MIQRWCILSLWLNQFYATGDAALFSNSSTSSSLTANGPAKVSSTTSTLSSSSNEPLLIDTISPPEKSSATSRRSTSSEEPLLIDTRPPPVPPGKSTITSKSNVSTSTAESLLIDTRPNPASHVGDPGFSTLISSCNYLWSSSFTAWESTATLSTLHITTPTTTVPLGSTWWINTAPNGAVSSGSFTRSPVYSYFTETGLNSAVGRIFTFSDTGPCCGACSVRGGQVQIYYWPAATAAPNAKSNIGPSTLVDHNNFTFISPSVYVAFESLYATDKCGYIGSRYLATTLAFGPDELSTTIGYEWDSINKTLHVIPEVLWTQTFTQATWGDHTSCTDSVSTLSQPIAIYFISGTISMQYETFTASYNLCSPTLSLPTEVLTVNTAWHNCFPGISGLWDPPYTLTPGQNFMTVQSASSPVAQQATTAPANPGASPVPATPTPTPTVPVPQSSQNVPDPADNLPSSDPPSNDPPASGNPGQAIPGNNSPVNNDPTQSAPTQNASPANPVPTKVIIDDIAFGPAPLPLIIGSSTLKQGGSPVTEDGTVYSLSPNGASLIIDGSVTRLLKDPSGAIRQTPAYVIGSQTLVAGSAMTVSGMAVSLLLDGEHVVVGSKTMVIGDFVGGVIAGEASPSTFIVGGQTLVAGGTAATIAGTAVSLMPGGKSVVVGGKNMALSDYLAGGGHVVIAGQTIGPGAAAAISGKVVSLMPGGSNVVVDGKTEALSQYLSDVGNGVSLVANGKTQSLGATTTGDGLGGIIATMGGFATTSSSNGAAKTASPSGGEFTGDGSVSLDRNVWVMCVVIGASLMGVFIL